MTPEVRAIADRFIYEQATLKHIASLAPEGALDRPVPGTDWTVRQLLGHLAQSLNDYAEMVRKLAGGEPPIPQGWDPHAVNAETVARLEKASLTDLFQLFGSGINDLVAELTAIPDGRVEEQSGPTPAMSTLQVLAGHCLTHAIPLVEALPEVRMDALVLNWLLYADFETDEGRAWQDALMKEAQAYIESLPDEEEDDE